MKSTALQIETNGVNFQLPEVARTKSGVEFQPRQDIWKFRDAINTVYLNFDRLMAAASLAQNAKSAFLWYAENAASATLVGHFGQFVHFCKTLSSLYGAPITGIGSDEIINYKSALSKKNAWQLGKLSAFFRRWHALGVPGITDEAAKLLEGLRIPGMVKGVSVLTMDPIHGPFNDIEFESVQAAIHAAHEAGTLDLHDFVLVMLFMCLGQRSTQYAALKVRDVGCSAGRDGTIIYSLKMPRAKQKGGLVREQFKDRLLHPNLGELLIKHAKEVEIAFTGILPDAGDAPLFPAKQSRHQEPPGFEFHRTGLSIGVLLSNIIGFLGVASVRTGELMNITPYRFRRTTGTRAAIEGHGELVIAELLDHTDTQNVGVYVQAVPQIVERIDRAIAFHLAPLAQAFAGAIIADETEALRSGDPSSRICDPRFDSSMKPMGNCGRHGFCGAMAPIACYTCRSFQPWLDGPHEEVLDFLISERERLLAETDVRIASVNDITILAVAEVVIRCREMKQESIEVDNA